MKKVFLTGMAFLAAIITVNAQVSVWDGSHEEWTNGSGTKDDPYLIESAAQLAHLAYLVKEDMAYKGNYQIFGADTYYKLTTDINLNSLEWFPIGCRQLPNGSHWQHYYISHFGGYFDGNGHTIANLHIRTNNTDNDLESVGLFGHVQGATIRNLGIIGNDSIIAGNAGAIAGYCTGTTTITNCYNAMYISAGGTSGGIVGKSDGTITIINCYNKGKINGSKAGGIIGEITGMNTSNITNCYNTATIVATASNKIGGGIVGTGVINLHVVNCYNTGTAPNAIIATGGGKYTNCYVLEGSASTPLEVQALTETVMKSPEFVEMLGCSFMQDAEPYQNAGYPVHSGFLLETREVSDITDTSVTLSATLESGNTAPVLQKGFQYKAFTADNYISINLPADAFSYNLTGLTSGRAYRFKPFVVTATNDTVYGIERSFTTIHNGSRAIWDGSITPVTPDGDTYYIYFPDELAWIAQQCNSGYNFAGKNVVLMNDLDLNGSELLQWTPIGHTGINCELYNRDCNYSFAGNFEGNNHSIYNLYINKNAEYLGLFGSANGASISNLSLANGSIIATASYGGAIIGWASNNTTITNCHNAMTVSGSGYLGGIVGAAAGYSIGARIENCTNSGNVSGGIVGGIVGHLFNSSVMDCRNSGTISGSDVGGIAGGISKGEISGCYNTGTILGSFPRYYTNGAGGIVGITSFGSSGPMTITNCHNSGNLTNTSGGTIGIGGILGNSVGDMSSSSIITHCSNAGNIAIHCTAYAGEISISGSNYVNCGGIVGDWGSGSASDFPITNCYNTGNISVSGDDITRNAAGGIVGGAMSLNAPIINCYNTGNISVSGDMNYNNIGGIMGLDLVGSTEFINCYNTGSISYSGTATFSDLGGLHGDGHTYTSSTNSYYLETCGGGLIGIPKPDAEMKTAEFVDLLNSGSNTRIYRQDLPPYTNSGYPILCGMDMETFAARSVTQTKAQFGGYIKPVLPVTSHGFLYKAASDSVYTVVEVNINSDTLTYQATGLIAGMEYRYRTFGIYQNDTVYAYEQLFTTLPVAMSVSHSSISATEVTLTGSFNAGDATISSSHIEYRLANDTAVWINAGENLMTVHLTGLLPNKTYHYRLVAIEGNNTYYSNVQGFITKPIVTTLPATDITPLSASLNAIMTVGDEEYIGAFEIELSSAPQHSGTLCQYILFVDTFSCNIAPDELGWNYPLLPDREYHYRAYVSGGSGGRIYGETVTFTTLPAYVDSIRLEQTSLTFLANSTAQLTYSIYPTNATNQNVAWTSDNPDVATVSQTGLVTAHQGGTATITATTEDGGKTATCTVIIYAAQSTPFTIDFESTTEGWVLANGSQPNKWVTGTATAASGVKSVYISNNGTDNVYNTEKHPSIVHFYCDVTFTPSANKGYQLSFDWKGVGEASYGTIYDYMNVYLVETSVTPVAANLLTYTPLGTYNGSDTWQHVTLILPTSYTGTTKRLVFTWKNDSYVGTQPPAAIDNISVVPQILSANATLSSLTVSAGTLTPAFDANTENYTVNVANDVTNINVTGTANHTGATVNGNVTAKALNVGNNAVSITVTAEDETTTMTYTVTIVRAVSSDARLSSLTLSAGFLSFNPAITSYTVNVSNNVTSINITGTANHTAATVDGNVTGKPLEIGDNVVTITVTAENGTTTKAYTVTIVRAASSDATLKNLTVSAGTLSPAFHSTITFYTVTVPNDVTSIDVTGTANHTAATVSGNVTGKALDVGDNIVDIVVTAEDGIIAMAYMVIVTRLPVFTGVEETLQADISAYPNPFKGEVRLTGAEGCMLTVFTTTGAAVHTQKVTGADETIHLEHLPAGLYLFRLEKDGKTKTLKIVNNE